MLVIEGCCSLDPSLSRRGRRLLLYRVSMTGGGLDCEYQADCCVKHIPEDEAAPDMDFTRDGLGKL